MSTREEYKYRTEAELKGRLHRGQFDAYSGGGYVLPLTDAKAALVAHVDRLKGEGWIDNG